MDRVKSVFPIWDIVIMIISLTATTIYSADNNKVLILDQQEFNFGYLSFTVSLVSSLWIHHNLVLVFVLLFVISSQTLFIWESLWYSGELLCRTQRAEKILRWLWSFHKDNLFFTKDKQDMLANKVNLWESVKQYKQGLNRSHICIENKVELNL